MSKRCAGCLHHLPVFPLLPLGELDRLPCSSTTNSLAQTGELPAYTVALYVPLVTTEYWRVWNCAREWLPVRSSDPSAEENTYVALPPPVPGPVISSRTSPAPLASSGSSNLMGTFDTAALPRCSINSSGFSGNLR
ncbi:hypothetical protein [Brevibacillus massiliensis]|uniref:hypothetical protein n=1 Tax=Brevibacillus massiliensis TaxID=1118054 RepID=UPI00164DC424|nr:hypothetical protein [Brevibacillus massiliensis]